MTAMTIKRAACLLSALLALAAAYRVHAQ